MAISKPDLTYSEFTKQFTDLGKKLPFLSDEQKWGFIYACWKSNKAIKDEKGDKLVDDDLYTIDEYVELIIKGATDSYYTMVVADKSAWIGELSSSPEMTALLIQQAQLPENAGKSISEIASSMPFLFNV